MKQTIEYFEKHRREYVLESKEWIEIKTIIVNYLDFYFNSMFLNHIFMIRDITKHIRNNMNDKRIKDCNIISATTRGYIIKVMNKKIPRDYDFVVIENKKRDSKYQKIESF